MSLSPPRLALLLALPLPPALLLRRPGPGLGSLQAPALPPLPLTAHVGGHPHLVEGGEGGREREEGEGKRGSLAYCSYDKGTLKEYQGHICVSTGSSLR